MNVKRKLARDIYERAKNSNETDAVKLREVAGYLRIGKIEEARQAAINLAVDVVIPE